MSTGYTMPRMPDLLPGTLDLLMLRTHQGWIEAEWKVSELGRRAKYYHLTASGRRHLAVEARNGSDWQTLSAA